MLRYGYAKAKFTANATYRQTLAVQAATAVKADALKARQHLAVAAVKGAASGAVNAEAATGKVEAVTIAGDQVDQAVVTSVAAEAVPVDLIVREAVARVAVEIARVEIVQAVRERDNK